MINFSSIVRDPSKSAYFLDFLGSLDVQKESNVEENSITDTKEQNKLLFLMECERLKVVPEADLRTQVMISLFQ